MRKTLKVAFGWSLFFLLLGGIWFFTLRSFFMDQFSRYYSVRRAMFEFALCSASSLFGCWLSLKVAKRLEKAIIYACLHPHGPP